MRLGNSAVVLFLLGRLPITVTADQECVPGSIVWQNEKYDYFLSWDGDKPFVNSYISQALAESTNAMRYKFARMYEVPCLSKDDPNFSCPHGGECVSFQSTSDPNWYFAGSFEYNHSPSFYDITSTSIIQNIPTPDLMSWCKTPALSGTEGAYSLSNLGDHKHLHGTTFTVKSQLHEPPASGAASWFPRHDVCCEGGAFMCGDRLGAGEGGANGDPHFRTWSGKRYDFHGGCDLVLMQNPDFAHGLGMDIHIRTKIETWWSYIEAAVLRVGDHTLQVMGGTDTCHYWLNGQKEEFQNGETNLGEFAVQFHRVKDSICKAEIELGGGDSIVLATFKTFVKVNIKAKNSGNFKGSAGLMGTYPDGRMMARNGTKVIKNSDQFGQEWQVLSSEPMLFHSPPEDEPGLLDKVMHAFDEEKPRKCTMPDTETYRAIASRRLGEAAISEEDAALACARVDEKERDACIFDVLATNDMEMAGSY